MDRAVSFAAAGLLLGFSRNAKPSWGVAMKLGALEMLRRGITGYCPGYELLGLRTAPNQAAVPYELGVHVQGSVIINKLPDEVYEFYRDFENLPRFMRRLRAVKHVGGNVWRWEMDGPGGRILGWDAEVHNEVPNQRIAWKTLPGADVASAGSVRFIATRDAKTEVRVKMQYNPPGGRLGAAAARIIGHSPEREIEEDLHRLKMVLETGSIEDREAPRVISRLEPA